MLNNMNLYKIICFCLLIIFSQNLAAQNCVPVDRYPGVPFWQYPDTDAGFVLGYEGEPYNEVLEFRLPNKISDVDPNTPFNIDVDHVKIQSVIGLPSGLEFTCSTGAACEYAPNDLGCLNIFGTPETAGVYPIDVTFRIFPVGLPAFNYKLNEYSIEIFESGTTGNASTTVTKYEERIDSLSFKYIEVNTLITGEENLDVYFGMNFDDTEVQFKMFNITGKEIESRSIIGKRFKENKVSIDVSNYSNGMYFITIYERKRKITQKVLIQRG